MLPLYRLFHPFGCALLSSLIALCAPYITRTFVLGPSATQHIGPNAHLQKYYKVIGPVCTSLHNAHCVLQNHSQKALNAFPSVVDVAQAFGSVMQCRRVEDEGTRHAAYYCSEQHQMTSQKNFILQKPRLRSSKNQPIQDIKHLC